MITSLLILASPYQYRFASAYVDYMPPWAWVGMLYSLIIYLLDLIRTERRANRRASGLVVLTGMICTNYSTLPFQMGDGTGFDATWGKFWAITLLVLASVIPISSYTYYLRREMERNRTSSITADPS